MCWFLLEIQTYSRPVGFECSRVVHLTSQTLVWFRFISADRSACLVIYSDDTTDPIIYPCYWSRQQINW